jgi:tRNA(Ile)-lysidine synthase
MDLAGRVRAFGERHGLWAADTPIVAAVSGGADSVALLLVLHDLARQGLVRLVGVAHLHHHIRGTAADDDAAFVARLAERLTLPLEVAHADVPAAARQAGQSLEVAGRQARLAFFERLAALPGAPVVALAHTRSDQAETVILRLVRGAGPRGLAGMAPRTGHRIRPLLEIGREPLRAWLRARGEAWREDETNQDPGIARNLIRRSVLPRLEQLNPAAEEALARAARIQALDADLLDRLAAVESGRLLQRDGDTVRFDLGALKRLHGALGRRVARQALQMIDPRHTSGWEDSEAVLGAVTPREIGAVRLELFGHLAVLSNRSRREPARVASPHPSAALALEVPGTVRHPAGWWEVEAVGPLAPPATVAASSDGTQAVLDAAALGRHLTIRAWQPGDRVQPLGLGGRKKLQDVFVDRKVPRDERPYVPIVVDAQGRVAWVAGHVVGEPFRVTPHSEAVVVLTLRR